MVRVKTTSIYVDRDLWKRFRDYARRKGIEASRLLEELMLEAMLEEEVLRALEALEEKPLLELDFEPVEPRGGTVSELVRETRDEQANSISR
ncbi:hypothetical protein [Pyrodictium abyssi]|uniref:CopG family transcriptional regulator n=1 Tax=Pyrodictium abyssi TaxID=54256 RepID=A0ABN6ZQ30_9CREN|nr:hypothetical protein PABY_19190 [Pyrodictium abyssi]